MPFLLAAAGIGLLLLGGEVIVRNAAGLALRAGLSPLFVGLTVVAMGTSSPELAACLGAGGSGLGGLALGNVVGSNIANIGLILGLSALVVPMKVRPRLIRWDLPLMIGATVILFAMLRDRFLGRGEGVLLAACLVLYISVSYWFSRIPKDVGPGDWKKRDPNPTERLLRSIFGIVLGLGLLVLGGRLLVEGSVAVATSFGISDAIIGLTLVAAGTSLPELATSLVAVRRGQPDIALGNVIGSNLFNTMFVLGVTGIVTPVGSQAVRSEDLVIMLGMSVLLLPLLWTRRRLGRWEGGALLSTFLVYFVWIFLR
jgi:cation:H+ antiporter